MGAYFFSANLIEVTNGSHERAPVIAMPSANDASFRERVAAFLRTHSATIRSLLLILLSAWLVVTWSLTVQRILRYYTPVPTFDYWRTGMFLQAYETFNLRCLWFQHNEHRIVFPEILFAADYLLLHGRQIIPIAASFLCCLGTWAAMGWAFWPCKSISAPLRTMGILLAGIITGWQGSAAVLVSPFLLQWTLTQLTVLLSLAALVRLRETGRNRYLVTCIICAAVATYSSGSGLLLWPILIGAGMVLSIRRGQMAALGCAGAALVSLYFVGYRFTGTLSIGNLIHHPIYTLKFEGSYLSMPFGANTSAQFGAGLGIASMCIVAMLAIVVARAGLLSGRTAIVLFGAYLYIALSGVLIAAGRMDPGDRNLANARPPRYLMGPLAGWAVFILLCLWVGSRFGRKAVAGYAIVLGFSGLLLAGLSGLGGWLRDRDAEAATSQFAALAMENDLLDQGLMVNIFPWHTLRAENWAAALRDGNFSVYYKGHRRWLGRQAHSFAALSTNRIPGEITYTFPVLNGIEVAGWADATQAHGRASWILLANESGRIVGFGRQLPAGFPRAVQNFRTPAQFGWVGFVNSSYPVKSIQAYFISKQGLSALDGSTAAPDIQLIAGQQAGPEIPRIEWQRDKTWTANRLPQDRYYGVAPSSPVYSTWNGYGGDTGRILSSSFPAPANRCVIVPVLQGPRADHLSVGIVDADTDRVVASIPLQSSPQQWNFWRMPLGSEVKNLRVAAEDNGKEWNEWLALGNPRQCQ